MKLYNSFGEVSKFKFQNVTLNNLVCQAVLTVKECNFLNFRNNYLEIFIYYGSLKYVMTETYQDYTWSQLGSELIFISFWFTGLGVFEECQ